MGEEAEDKKQLLRKALNRYLNSQHLVRKRVKRKRQGRVLNRNNPGNRARQLLTKRLRRRRQLLEARSQLLNS